MQIFFEGQQGEAPLSTPTKLQVHTILCYDNHPVFSRWCCETQYYYLMWSVFRLPLDPMRTLYPMDRHLWVGVDEFTYQITSRKIEMMMWVCEKTLCHRTNLVLGGTPVAIQPTHFIEHDSCAQFHKYNLQPWLSEKHALCGGWQTGEQNVHSGKCNNWCKSEAWPKDQRSKLNWICQLVKRCTQKITLVKNQLEPNQVTENGLMQNPNTQRTLAPCIGEICSGHTFRQFWHSCWLIWRFPCLLCHFPQGCIFDPKTHTRRISLVGHWMFPFVFDCCWCCFFKTIFVWKHAWKSLHMLWSSIFQLNLWNLCHNFKWPIDVVHGGNCFPATNKFFHIVNKMHNEDGILDWTAFDAIVWLRAISTTGVIFICGADWLTHTQKT